MLQSLLVQVPSPLEPHNPPEIPMKEKVPEMKGEGTPNGHALGLELPCAIWKKVPDLDPTLPLNTHSSVKIENPFGYIVPLSTPTHVPVTIPVSFSEKVEV